MQYADNIHQIGGGGYAILPGKARISLIDDKLPI